MSSRSKGAILIVDDEKDILSTLSRALRVEQFDVDVAGSGAIALERAKSKAYDAILLDVMMPEMTGLQVLKELRAQKIATPVIVMSGHGTLETAVEATRLGAHDYLEKPIGTERLLLSLSRALEFHKLAEENVELRKRSGFNALIGDSAPMRKLREQIALAANANAPVLVTGERGTGKELVARAIHEASKRVDGPLEKLNCAAVPNDLIESELFGHEAGAFTGATRQRRGKFERASGGSLFLDEVGDMPLNMQAKLLRVLQEGELERVGGSDLLRVDVRVIAATNKSLEEEIRAGNFRADLFDRLNVLPLHLPPLRERRGDIRTLATTFIALASEANDRAPKTFTDGAVKALESHDYPGNVRELRNLIERIVILTPRNEVTESDVRTLFHRSIGQTSANLYQPGQTLRVLVDDVERAIITQALEHHDHNVSKTAQDLGLERSHLYKKMRALGLRTKGPDEPAESGD